MHDAFSGQTIPPPRAPEAADSLGREWASPGMRRRDFLIKAGVLSVAAAALPACLPGEEETRAPSFRLGEGDRFDASTVPPYEGAHPAVYRYIDANLDRHIEEIRRWLRQPSVSAQNLGIEEMAVMLRDDLRGLGFQEAELVPTSGHPGVWGYYDAGAARTLMVYLMYDVQPVEEEDWQVSPFAAELVETELGTVVMARGATNQKGPQRAFLNAVEAILAVDGRLPVNIMIAAEGEEEIGSPHYPEIIDRYEERLRTAEGVFFPFNRQDGTGEASLSMGVKGILYMELEASGGAGQGGPTRAEIHGSNKVLVDAPAWRLVQALATLTSSDGNTIAVEGYYDAVRPPIEEERNLVRGVLEAWDEQLMREALGVEQWIDGLTGEAALMRYLFHPSLNINGMWSGYTGPGVKTILPHRATAKVDSRLVPDQTPDEAERLIRRQLDAYGFQDIEIRRLAGYPWARTSVEAGIVQNTIGVFNKYGHIPVVWPRGAGSAPYYQFTDRLGLPLVPGGLGHGARAHAPNEYMVLRPRAGSAIAGLAEIERSYADLLYAVA